MLPFYQDSDYARVFDEHNEKPYFSPFRRDYARLIHSASFRRLQGKTQVYPGYESDFFRNRLTHSLEVEQVAKSIAIRINTLHDLKIDYDLIECVALCHDIGHSPFGHNGEVALHEKMRPYGGFEGNAQTLRLLAKTEKKIRSWDAVSGEYTRYGLNLTYRTLASVLKYDRSIPPFIVSSRKEPIKGYYHSEAALVKSIRAQVLQGYPEEIQRDSNLRVIECSIMDLADDIAYSTYDIEDAFKGELITPMDLLYPSETLLSQVSTYLSEYEDIALLNVEIKEILRRAFQGVLDINAPDLYLQSKHLIGSGYERTNFTSSLVAQCIANVQFEWNEICPILSSVYLSKEVHLQVQVLKYFVYAAIIRSPRMEVIRYRGREVISKLFDILIDSDPQIQNLLPKDVGELFYACAKDDFSSRARIVSDFISGMTDRYAVELYGRLMSDTPRSIFQPI